MKDINRILSLVLAVLMLASVLLIATACGETVETPVGSEDPDGSVAGTVAESETESPYAQLEKEKYNREFTILIRDDCVEDFIVSGMTGDLLADSLYERNTMVSDDYGVEFVYQYQGFGYINVNEALKQQVSGGLDDYDLFIGH